MSNQAPSQGLDPSDNDSLGGTFRRILKKTLQGTDDMLPCVVVAVTTDRNFVTVKPLIMVLGTEGGQVARAQIAKVPVFTMGAGKYVLSFPIAAGDLGWIKANDRDISLFIQSNSETTPNTQRLHSFEDGVFFPDAARKWSLSADDAQNVVLQSYDGTQKITLGPAGTTVKDPTKVTVDTPTAHFTGNLTADGTVTGKTDVLAGPSNISGKSHTHDGVTTGSGNTGAPNA